jgi:hypothetical protein
MIDAAKTLYNKEFNFNVEEGNFYKNLRNKNKNLYKTQKKYDGEKIIVISERKFKIIYFN